MDSYFDGPTYPFYNPYKTFDGFWVSKELSKRVNYGKADRVFVDHYRPLSDHLGVKLTLEVDDFASAD